MWAIMRAMAKAHARAASLMYEPLFHSVSCMICLPADFCLKAMAWALSLAVVENASWRCVNWGNSIANNIACISTHRAADHGVKLRHS